MEAAQATALGDGVSGTIGVLSRGRRADGPGRKCDVARDATADAVIEAVANLETNECD